MSGIQIDESWKTKAQAEKDAQSQKTSETEESEKPAPQFSPEVQELIEKLREKCSGVIIYAAVKDEEGGSTVRVAHDGSPDVVYQMFIRAIEETMGWCIQAFVRMNIDNMIRKQREIVSRAAVQQAVNSPNAPATKPRRR